MTPVLKGMLVHSARLNTLPPLPTLGVLLSVPDMQDSHEGFTHSRTMQ